MSSEMEKFQKDLLESVQQMKRGKAARVMEVELSPVAAARSHVGMSQRDFAGLLGVSPPHFSGLGTRTPRANWRR